jgi:putative ABC transport system permease protein
MKTSMYFNYTSRSLLRGGQRTVLAFFCVGVGVMAIVALQLVGLMVNNALTANVRDANGGDINVSSGVGSRAFTQSDLNYFAGLKKNGTITNYTALNRLTGTFSNTLSATNSFAVLLVDPATFPIVTPPTFTAPSNGSIASLLTGNSAIIDQQVASTYHKQVGDTLRIHITLSQQNAQLLTVKVAGIVTDTGVLAQESGVILVSQAYYYQTFPQTPQVFTSIDITTANQAKTDAAVKQIENQYPLATVQTASDALKTVQSESNTIDEFLEIAGLLALLIGGVGIVNTMQVLLSRRRVEIAMLKTTGYRRFDLYLLFGLEAGMLGLVGGALGSAAAIGVSYLVRNLVEQVFSLNIPFLLNWTIIGGGVLIGLATALIFGLMPIVQSANIRPLSVIRELPESNRAGSIGLTILLLLILSVLFCVMSAIILNNIGLAIGAVYGSFVFLLILSGFFTLVALLVSLLPVPERFNFGFIGLIIGCGIVSGLISLVLPAFGYLLLALTVVGFLIVFMPRTWKSNTKMALRNIGRQRARTTTTLLALFVGIFTIGLILVLGQNVRDLINNSLSNLLTYNIITSASGSDAARLEAQINTVPGVQKSVQRYTASMAPIAINGQPLGDILRGTPQYPSAGNLGRLGVLSLLSSMQGYDVASGSVPDPNSISIIAGSNLQASDANTNDILVPYSLTDLAPLKGKLGVGSTITVTSMDGKSTVTLKVVGIYRQKGFDLSSGTIVGVKGTVAALSPGGVIQSLFYIKVDTSKVNQALAKIAQIAPTSESFSLANIGDFIDQYLNDFILVLVTIASLSLLAGVIIIANAVALAMLERRRELGILKSVGYTSSTVLGEVLIENAVIGGLGALLAMLLVTFVTSLLGQLVFKSNFSVNGLVEIGLILGSALLAMLTAMLVAWGSVRVRPLAVLRYE